MRVTVCFGYIKNYYNTIFSYAVMIYKYLFNK